MAVSVVDIQVNSSGAVRSLQQLNVAAKGVTATIGSLAAALGVPIPGKQESPHRNNPSTGVFKLGKGKGNTLPRIPD